MNKTNQKKVYMKATKKKTPNKKIKLKNTTFSSSKLLIFILLFACVGVFFLIRSFAATPNATEKMGVFRGSGKPDQTAGYETWLGRPVTYALDFVGRTDDAAVDPWKIIDSPGWWCSSWSSTKYTPVFSTAILPNNNLTLAAGARGEYNAHWKKFGEVMVARGCADSVLRLGWEFNGKFYPWAAGGKEADYAAYWRQIVTTLRAVPGQSFKFDWCPLAGNTGANVEAAYPGDGYVDIIGSDTYDNSPVHTSEADRWNDQLNRKYGIKWHKDFAVNHGKAISFPEWGLSDRPNDNLGGGDNPYYIQKMYDWMNALPATGGGSLAYHAYFEVDANDGSHRLMLGQYPNSATIFKKLFGVLPSTSTADTTPPSVPTSLSAIPTSETQINLSWQNSTDNVGVASYDVYRGNSKIGSALNASFTDTSLAPGTKYDYYVVAKDKSGNVSNASNTASATTTSSTVVSYTTTTRKGTLSKYESKAFNERLPKAGTIKYSLTSPQNARYDVRVYNSAGVLVEERLNATTPFSDSFTIGKPDIYKFKVTTKWWSSNSFSLNVTYPY